MSTFSRPMRRRFFFTPSSPWRAFSLAMRSWRRSSLVFFLGLVDWLMAERSILPTTLMLVFNDGIDVVKISGSFFSATSAGAGVAAGSASASGSGSLTAAATGATTGGTSASSGMAGASGCSSCDAGTCSTGAGCGSTTGSAGFAGSASCATGASGSCFGAGSSFLAGLPVLSRSILPITLGLRSSVSVLATSVAGFAASSSAACFDFSFSFCRALVKYSDLSFCSMSGLNSLMSISSTSSSILVLGVTSMSIFFLAKKS